jgi:hypothetical protein
VLNIQYSSVFCVKNLLTVLLLYVEHCGKIYLHKISRYNVCWALWGYLFTQHTGDYFMVSITVLNIKYSSVFCVNKSSHSAQHTVYSSVFCVNKSSHSVQHTVFLSILKILRNTVCWALWEDLFTQHTGDYFLLNTVGIFIYINHWEILYVEHGKT